MMNLGNLQNPEFSQALRQFIEGVKNSGFMQTSENMIKDEDILSLRNNLKDNTSFQDLFN